MSKVIKINVGSWPIVDSRFSLFAQVRGTK
jgi:hypothetical protein